MPSSDAALNVPPAGNGAHAAGEEAERGRSAHLWSIPLALLRIVGGRGCLQRGPIPAQLHLPQVFAVLQVKDRQAGGPQPYVLLVGSQEGTRRSQQACRPEAGGACKS